MLPPVVLVESTVNHRRDVNAGGEFRRQGLVDNVSNAVAAELIGQYDKIIVSLVKPRAQSVGGIPEETPFTLDD
jgi:hypothetical protein